MYNSLSLVFRDVFLYDKTSPLFSAQFTKVFMNKAVSFQEFSLQNQFKFPSKSIMHEPLSNIIQNSFIPRFIIRAENIKDTKAPEYAMNPTIDHSALIDFRLTLLKCISTTIESNSSNITHLNWLFESKTLFIPELYFGVCNCVLGVMKWIDSQSAHALIQSTQYRPNLTRIIHKAKRPLEQKSAKTKKVQAKNVASDVSAKNVKTRKRKKSEITKNQKESGKVQKSRKKPKKNPKTRKEENPQSRKAEENLGVDAIDLTKECKPNSRAKSQKGKSIKTKRKPGSKKTKSQLPNQKAIKGRNKRSAIYRSGNSMLINLPLEQRNLVQFIKTVFHSIISFIQQITQHSMDSSLKNCSDAKTKVPTRLNTCRWAEQLCGLAILWRVFMSPGLPRLHFSSCCMMNSLTLSCLQMWERSADAINEMSKNTSCLFATIPDMADKEHILNVERACDLVLSMLLSTQRLKNLFCDIEDTILTLSNGGVNMLAKKSVHWLVQDAINTRAATESAPSSNSIEYVSWIEVGGKSPEADSSAIHDIPIALPRVAWLTESMNSHQNVYELSSLHKCMFILALSPLCIKSDDVANRLEKKIQSWFLSAKQLAISFKQRDDHRSSLSISTAGDKNQGLLPDEAAIIVIACACARFLPIYILSRRIVEIRKLEKMKQAHKRMVKKKSIKMKKNRQKHKVQLDDIEEVEEIESEEFKDQNIQENSTCKDYYFSNTDDSWHYSTLVLLDVVR